MDQEAPVFPRGGEVALMETASHRDPGGGPGTIVPTHLHSDGAIGSENLLSSMGHRWRPESHAFGLGRGPPPTLPSFVQDLCGG
jgi:hypothetical protein